jgi:DNA-binding transcriptional ArsR family regulator
MPYACGVDGDISDIAALLTDPTRVVMLEALLDGRALPAGELARCARIGPPTASAHLRRLLELGWLVGGRVPRGLVLTDTGRDGLVRTFGCDPAALQDQTGDGQCWSR